MSTNATGTRLITQKHEKAEEIARSFTGLEAGDDRFLVIRILRDIGTEIGWSSRLVTHLEGLITFTRDRDWEAGGIPIVWISQRQMAKKLGISRAQANRNERRMMELGAIAFADSSNHRRFGRRNERGHIEQGYGIDLRPTAALVENLKAQREVILQQQRAQQDQRTAVMGLRQRIRGILAAPENQQIIPHELASEIANDNSLYQRVPRNQALDALVQLFQHLQSLYNRLRSALLRSDKQARASKPASSQPVHANMRRKGHKNETPASQKCNTPYDYYKRKPQDKSCSAGALGRHTGTRPAGHGGTDDVSEPRLARPAAPPRSPRQESAARPAYALGKAVPGDALMKLIPDEIVMYLEPESPPDWRSLLEACHRSLHHYGINQRLWGDLCQALSRNGAVLALIITTNKVARGLVGSPGGYLQGMLLKAEMGQLNLRASLFGLAKAGGTLPQTQEDVSLDDMESASGLKEQLQLIMRRQR